MPKPGDIGLMRIPGPVGLAIRAGEFLNGDGFKDFEHAVICTSAHDGIGIPTVMEARPGGAGTATYADREILWLRSAVGRNPGADDLNYAQRTEIVAAAYNCMGVPYSFLDYSALALHRFGVPAPGLREYIADSHHMICSQMVDWCYQQAGIELFDDGRWNGYVTPLDLWKLYPQGKLVQA